MKRPTKKAFREFLNAEENRDSAHHLGNHINGRYQQRTRKYGDYLYFQDREKFDIEFAEWAEKQETQR